MNCVELALVISKVRTCLVHQGPPGSIGQVWTSRCGSSGKPRSPRTMWSAWPTPATYTTPTYGGSCPQKNAFCLLQTRCFFVLRKHSVCLFNMLDKENGSKVCFVKKGNINSVCLFNMAPKFLVLKKHSVCFSTQSTKKMVPTCSCLK